MLVDLEDALALETARSGQAATAEVTSVLRTLPGEARQRLPLRVRHPGAWAGALALLALAGALVLIFVLGRTHKGVGAGGTHVGQGLVAVSLGQSAAYSYNPFGTGPEDRGQLSNLIDDDPNSTWSTEQYFDGTLKKEHGTGTGVYLDAAPSLAAKALEIQTTTPGFPVQLYVANAIEELPYGDATPLSGRGWHGPVSSSSFVKNGERLMLALGGHAWRYYLIWLTALPPGDSATIAELTLFR
jgi:serine/threonine-protein kinase